MDTSDGQRENDFNLFDHPLIGAQSASINAMEKISMRSAHRGILSMFTGAEISICCSVSPSIGEHRNGSDGCHHDTDHDMLHTHTCAHSLASLPPLKQIHPRERKKGVRLCPR